MSGSPKRRGVVDWTRPEMEQHKREWTAFLTQLAHAMNGAPRPYKAWTVEVLEANFLDLERIFYQRHTRRWAMRDLSLSAHPNFFPVMSFLGNEVLPLLHRISPDIKLGVNNGYRTLEENTRLKSKPTSQHRLGGALDMRVSPSSYYEDMCYIIDRLLYGQGTSLLGLVGYGIYNHDGFIHIDMRVGKGSSFTWFGKPGGGVTSRLPGVIRYKDKLAGINASVIPERSAALGLPAAGAGMSAARLTGPPPPPPGEVYASLNSVDGGDDQDGAGDRAGMARIVHDDGLGGRLELAGAGLADYVTPEETSKGIISAMMTLDDWTLTQLVGEQAELDRLSGVKKAVKDQLSSGLQALGKRATLSTQAKANIGAIRADLSDDPRRRYVQSLVEAEFWSRRVESRSVPQVSGRFNPYPVAGFPALVLTPDRPVIAEITSINHSFSVGGANASTSISLGAPRYWDEGEPWYYLGGWGAEDHGSSGELFRRYWQRYPYWHNHLAMPTNSWMEPGQKSMRDTPLDRFYMGLLGCKAIPYESNHAWKLRAQGTLEYDYDRMQRAIRDRDTAFLDVNPLTLELKEYNTHIAKTDEQGYFAKGTIAREFWGKIKPYSSPESIDEPPASGVEYVERYGVTERELLIDFLGNKAGQYNGRLVVTGPTFGGGGNGEQAVSEKQRSIIRYMESVESRSIGGGVRR